MEATKDMVWYHYPPIVIPSPVLALAAERGGVWAGGVGGVAWYPIQSDWEARISGLPLTSVAALVHVQGLLIAGGTEGIARSEDGGLSWKAADMQDEAASITAILLSPHFEQDHTLLAATLESGILRSDDRGKTWRLATFGLQSFDITSLAWGKGETVFAGTADGIFRSPNSGRAWRIVRGTEGLAVAAIVFLPDGSALATLETGGMWHSTDGGMRWSPLEQASAEIQGTTLMVTSDGSVLLGTVGHGIMRSTDGGISWTNVHDGTALAFTAHEKTLYAGMTEGLSVSVNDGATWISLPHPPIHDLRKLLVLDGQPLLAGLYAGILRYGAGAATRQTWTPLPDPPYPLLALEQIPPSSSEPDGALLAASPEGLFRSTNGGWAWECVRQDDNGQITHFTFRPDGKGWAGSADGLRLLRTQDYGKSWQTLDAPFGILPLASICAASDMIIAATYDPRQFRVQLWRSFDDGETWERGTEAETNWPVVTTWGQPALFTLAATMFVRQSDDRWHQTTIGNGNEAVRRLFGRDGLLLALTTNSLQRSDDEGTTWTQEAPDLPVDQVMDIKIVNDTLYALLTGGRVWSRPL